MRASVTRCALAFAACLLTLEGAYAADTLRLGKSVAFAWTFQVIDVGSQIGEWKKQGLDLEVGSFDGDAKLQQALAADSIDIGLGGGPGIGFPAKGAPDKAVAAFFGAPVSLSLDVAYDSPYHSFDDLKGKKIAVTTVGSLSDWLLHRAARAHDWKPGDIHAVALGGLGAFVAGLKTHQVDGLLLALEASLELQRKKEVRILDTMGKYAPHFHTHMIYARNELIKSRPDDIRRFLRGFFATVAYMKTHKQEVVDLTATNLNLDKSVASTTYDTEMSTFSSNGVFDPEALSVLKSSLVDMNVLRKPPANNQVLTTQFVPVNP